MPEPPWCKVRVPRCGHSATGEDGLCDACREEVSKPAAPPCKTCSVRHCCLELCRARIETTSSGSPQAESVEQDAPGEGDGTGGGGAILECFHDPAFRDAFNAANGDLAMEVIRRNARVRPGVAAAGAAFEAMAEVPMYDKTGMETLTARLLAMARDDDDEGAYPAHGHGADGPLDGWHCAYNRSSQPMRLRLNQALVHALRIAGHVTGDEVQHALVQETPVRAPRAADALRTGRDVYAVRALAYLAAQLEVREALPMLLAIAERGALGGHPGGLGDVVEGAVLMAIGGLQLPKMPPATRWIKLWEMDVPGLWSIAAVALLDADPELALTILPKIIERAMQNTGFEVDLVLWNFGTAEAYPPGKLAAELDARCPLSAAEHDRCRTGLLACGAEEAEIADWLPPPRRQPTE